MRRVLATVTLDAIVSDWSLEFDFEALQDNERIEVVLAFDAEACDFEIRVMIV